MLLNENKNKFSIRAKKFLNVYLLLAAVLLLFFAFLNLIDFWPSLDDPVIQEESKEIIENAMIIFQDIGYEIEEKLLLTAFSRKESWEKGVFSGVYKYSIGNNTDDIINIDWIVENNKIIITKIRKKYDDNYLYIRD